jgi:hypothetical protein
MGNNPNQNQIGQGGPKPGNFDQKPGQQNSQQGGFQHEPKPGADQQNKNPNQQGGHSGAQTKQGSRDENR